MADKPSDNDIRPEARRLLVNIKTSLPELRALLDECSGPWGYEDGMYRFYHQSFKVYSLQDATARIVAALRGLAPERGLNSWFESIVEEGTGKKFEPSHNQHWLEATRPIVEAFFHARYFLEMVAKYAEQLDSLPAHGIPSGWAAVLYLYGLR